MSEEKPIAPDPTNLNPSCAGASPSPRDEGAGRGEILENRPSSPRPSPPSEGGEGEAARGTLGKPVARGRRHWKWMLVALCIAVVLLFALPRLLDRQPRYQGRTIESWLQQSANGPESGQARLVLAGMGKEALPYLVKAFGRSDSALLDHYIALRDKLPSALREVIPERAKPAALRWAAKYELERRLDSPEFVSELVKLLDDFDRYVRLSAAWFFVFRQGHLPDNAAFPTHCRALEQDDAQVRFLTILAIIKMGSNAVGASPNLGRLLDNTDSAPQAAYALVAIHEPDFRAKLPTGIVARIEKLLSDTTNQVSNVTNR